MKITKDLDKGIWREWEDGVSICIRSYPLSKLIQLDDLSEPDKAHELFTYCVTGWRGFEWEDGSEMVYSDEHKQYIYDYYPQAINFVMEEITKDSNRYSINSKNSKSSQSGTPRKKTSVKDVDKPVGS